MEREVQTLLSHLHTADETRREVGVNVELSVFRSGATSKSRHK